MQPGINVKLQMSREDVSRCKIGDVSLFDFFKDTAGVTNPGDDWDLSEVDVSFTLTLKGDANKQEGGCQLASVMVMKEPGVDLKLIDEISTIIAKQIDIDMDKKMPIPGELIGGMWTVPDYQHGNDLLRYIARTFNYKGCRVELYGWGKTNAVRARYIGIPMKDHPIDVFESVEDDDPLGMLDNEEMGKERLLFIDKMYFQIRDCICGAIDVFLSENTPVLGQIVPNCEWDIDTEPPEALQRILKEFQYRGFKSRPYPLGPRPVIQFVYQEL